MIESVIEGKTSHFIPEVRKVVGWGKLIGEKMKNLIIVIIVVLLFGSLSASFAGPLDTEDEKKIVKAEFLAWLATSNVTEVKLDDVEKIVVLYDDDYIRNVMEIYEIDYPTGCDWAEFVNEYYRMIE